MLYYHMLCAESMLGQLMAYLQDTQQLDDALVSAYKRKG